MNAEPLFDQLLKGISASFEALPDKPEETPESVLRALWMTATGQPASAERAMQSTLARLDAGPLANLRDMIGRFQQGTPLAHITERQHFFGLELLTTPDALIPRKETELLAQAALTCIDQSANSSVLIVDVCTGCGNLPLLYAKHFPAARVFGADLSLSAIQLAKQNLAFTGLASTIEFRQGDLLDPFLNTDFEGQVDMLSCNPPYISSKKVLSMAKEISDHEPAMAFDGGAFGISILQKLIKQAPLLVKPGGRLVFELGLGQGPAIINKIERNPSYSHVEGRSDANGDIRVIIATVA